MSNSLKATILCCGITLLVSGCGGGGGGSSAVVKRSFTSFSAIPANTLVDIEGQSVESSYTANSASVTGISDLGTDSTAKSSLTYDTSGNISKLSIITDNGTISWDSATDTFDFSSPVLQVLSADTSNYGVAIDAEDMGWNYQTLGSWVSGIGAVTSSGRIGAISVGSRTDGSAVPTTGTATFTGMTTGIHIDAAGTAFFVAGATSIGADFTTRSLSFTTSNNNTVNLDDATTGINADLNLTGTLTYVAGSNNFSGAVTGAGINGTADGHFYGPSAEEAGGTFSLTGTGVESYIGAFGAKR
ncbi:transferrin-binding protein-like solute binding protein [Amphritea japonica]|uniref:Transferrin-binding protein B C-lobe/N-lobe beta-barrel domain-containing protein n=1 Tax=Amphritea japonica ATCC BAA-1530 TaxID=1278309 RepID=A0A7R6P9B0_9GAMM|nr:transferrin-binding protein-like solute binding protein [Amphritea japonica]BBB24936.1 conserved hypothetical protein [Amphritea japonica ATCC BAA-1530]